MSRIRANRHEPAPWLYRAVVFTLKALIRLLAWRVDVRGAEHIPATGPVVVVANHVSYLDPILIGLAVEDRGRVVRFLAKRELFDHWFTGPIMRGADQILVDRKGDAGAALKHAELAMLGGKLLVVFPEATIHPVFDPANAKTGSARLALTANVPVIPAGAWGGQQIATKGGRKRPGIRSSHTVRFGPPIPYDAGDSVALLTQRIMSCIAEVLDAAAAEHPRDLGPSVAAS